MVPICSNRFALGVVFIFLCLRDSFAYTHQLVEKLVVEDGSPLNFEKEVFNVVPTAVEAKNRRFEGGKTMEKGVMEKEMVLNNQVVNGEASKISGASNFVGNFNRKGKGKLNIEHKLIKHTSDPGPVNAKMVGFVALNADYHVPKSHPPKNN